eukprot:TRINITY_DN7041_c0_g2_i4.p1 TRINITY_DN7041_c0_g2~~TRINITY_DN7041_c0_g2_i4.p1  ORF type:complete len:175 (-),score=17.33 TRINITY_DN7041_c0_g2_i4:652-1176(-)
MEEKTVLVWPWSDRQKYHTLIDIFVNEQVPENPRSLYTPGCYLSGEELPEPCVTLKKSISLDSSTMDLSLLFIAGTGLDSDVPGKAQYDRSKCCLNTTNVSCEAIIVLVEADEKVRFLLDFYQIIFAKELVDTPTFLVSIDDSSMALCKDIREKVMFNSRQYMISLIKQGNGIV